MFQHWVLMFQHLKHVFHDQKHVFHAQKHKHLFYAARKIVFIFNKNAEVPLSTSES